MLAGRYRLDTRIAELIRYAATIVADESGNGIATVTVASALDEIEKTVKPALAREDFAGAMKAFAGLRAPIDSFFDKVTVNVTDKPDLRLNRLKLLNRIRATMDSVADFSKIEG